MSTNSEANLFSRPRSDAPWWVLPILTFITGIALTAAVLMPSVSTPEYKRGHADGYDQGMSECVDAKNRLAASLDAELRQLRTRVHELESLLASK